MENSSDFYMKKIGGIKYYAIKSFEEAGLVNHGFTTRIGGVSAAPFNSLNLGIYTDDSLDNIKENFNIVSKAFSTSIEKIVLSNQVHGTNIRIVDDINKARLGTSFSNEEGVDGLVTNLKDVMLCTFYADCVPIFYLDPKKSVIGLAHAGWKGTVNRIAGKMVEIMQQSYDSKAEDILVGIGPSIGLCCFEVNDDVYKIFLDNFSTHKDLYIKEGINKWRINLWKANESILEEKGILSRNISISNLCTCCNNNIFFSYRKEKGITGRMAALIQLK